MSTLGGYAMAAAGFWCEVPAEPSSVDPINPTLHISPGPDEPNEFNELVGLGPVPGSVLYEENPELGFSDRATPASTPKAKVLIDADAAAIEESFAPLDTFDVDEFGRRLQGRLGDQMLRQLLRVEADNLLGEEWGRLRRSR